MEPPLPTRAQLVIDGQIQELEIALSELRSQKNLRLPISKLSLELLGRIFAMVAPARKVDIFGENFVDRCYGFAFASKHLRYVALSTPGIWCLILPAYSNWARHCLERSRNASLKVEGSLKHGDVNSPGTLLVLDVIRNDMHRVQDLEITGCQSETAQLLLDAFPAVAPRLRKLYLNCYSRDGEMNVLQSSCLTSTKLSDLDLGGCDIDWKSSLLTGLTSLKIDNIRTQPTAEDFFAALARMPGLEKLELVHALPNASGPPSANRPPVKLSRLSHLRISSTLTDITQVMRHLLVPVQVNMHIDLYGPGKTSLFPLGATTVVSFLNEFFSRIQQSDGHTLQYDTLLAQYHFDTKEAVFIGWCKPWPDLRRLKIHREDSSDFRLILHWNHSPHPFVSQIISTFPVSHLKTLSLFATGGQRHPTGDIWQSPYFTSHYG